MSDHAVKRSGHMKVPAEGYFVDCKCGRLGTVRTRQEDAKQDHRDHVTAETTQERK